MGDQLKVNLIVAVDLNNGIGKDGRLPWSIPKEFQHFIGMISKSTPGTSPVLIMGRKTWEDFSNNLVHHHVQNAIIIIISNTLKDSPAGTHICTSYQDAIDLISNKTRLGEVYKVWNLGGSEIYKLGLYHPSFHRLYLTIIQGRYDCNIFFPEIDWTRFKRVHDPEVLQGVQEDVGVQFEIFVYEKL